MNKMKMFKRFTITMMAIILMVGVGIFISKPIDAYASQIETSEVTESLSVRYTDDADISRTLTFDIRCTYTAVWDEGYGGHIASATFWDATNEYVGNVPVSMQKFFPGSVTEGDKKVIVYYVGTIYVKVSISVDEWGGVDLWATKILREQADEYLEQYYSQYVI